MEEIRSNPTKWWQWVLVYPTLILGLFGSAPTLVQLYQSWKYDVTRAEVPFAKTQHLLWQRNAECQFNPPDWGTKILSINVDAKVCPTGDILISTSSYAKRKYVWIPIEDTFNNNSDTLFGIFNTAYASELSFQSETDSNEILICKRWLSNGELLRRIAIAESGCYDEIINTYNGEVIEKKAVSCDSSCQ